MVLWSLVSLGQFWLSGRGSFLATRWVVPYRGLIDGRGLTFLCL